MTTPSKAASKQTGGLSTPLPPLPDEHRRLLTAWAWLTDEQRTEFMDEMKAMAAANESRGSGHE